ncbi:MAG: outer membrane beta-barrel protein [Bacteroidota bacterium]
MNIFLFVAVGLLMYASANSQQHLFSASLKSSLTSEANLYENSSNVHSYSSFVGYGADVRRKIEGENIVLGCSAEYLTHAERYTNADANVSDKFILVPLEFTGYFIVPFSSNSVNFYIGGGVGGYFGNRTIKIGNVQAKVKENSGGVGIHVVSGIEYNITDFFALRSEVKFRDVQLESTYQFANQPNDNSGNPVFNVVPNTSYTSQLNVDGTTIEMALIFKL